MNVSKSSIDRLGERLRDGEEISDEDRDAFDAYRETFNEPLAHVQRVLVEDLDVGEPVLRSKTLESTVAKLRRQTARLSQVADIAGCRVTVLAPSIQDALVEQLQDAFPGSEVRDYRSVRQHGYRAVHVIVQSRGRAVEVQVRTTPQDARANASEAASDIYGIEVKYGGGEDSLRRDLDQMADGLERIDRGLEQLVQLRSRWEGMSAEVAELEATDDLNADLRARVMRLRADVDDNLRAIPLQIEEIERRVAAEVELGISLGESRAECS